MHTNDTTTDQPMWSQNPDNVVAVDETDGNTVDVEYLHDDHLVRITCTTDGGDSGVAVDLTPAQVRDLINALEALS